MNILIDTHIALWAFCSDLRLSDEARSLVLEPKNTIYYSRASMWEIAIKHRIKPSKIPIGATEFLHYCEMSGFHRLSIRDLHVVSFENLPAIHTDPFDNMLVAQAKSEGMSFLTHDEILRSYGEEFVKVV